MPDTLFLDRIQLIVKFPVKITTTGSLPTCTYNNGIAGVGATLTKTTNGAFPAQDSVTMLVGDRILVKNEVSTFRNGIYIVTSLGSGGTQWILTRSSDSNMSTEVFTGISVLIQQGTINRGFTFALTTIASPFIIGTTAQVWESKLISYIGAYCPYGVFDAPIELISALDSATLNRPLQYFGATNGTNGSVTCSGSVDVFVNEGSVQASFRMRIPININNFDRSGQAGGGCFNGTILCNAGEVIAESGNNFVIFNWITSEAEVTNTTTRSFNFTYQIV